MMQSTRLLLDIPTALLPQRQQQLAIDSQERKLLKFRHSVNTRAWHVQPVAAPHQQVVPANYKYAGLTLRRACSDSLLIDLRGMWHKYSPR
jgi:hypothetical protein